MSLPNDQDRPMAGATARADEAAEPDTADGHAAPAGVAAPAEPAEPATAAESSSRDGDESAAGLPIPPPPARPARRRGGALVIAGAIIAVVAGSTLFLAGWTLGRQTSLQPGTPVTEQEAWQPFWDTYAAITQHYAGGQVDRSALIQGAIKGMIGALNDPFSFYMTPAEFKASLQSISGQFSGIGTTVGTVDASGANATCTPLSATCQLAVESVIAGSPAEDAGLMAGDVITAVNGTSVDGLTVEQTTQRIRGPAGTTVTLSIARASVAPFQVTITRATILQPEVSTKTLAKGAVGYIKLAGFSDQASVDFRAAVAADVKAGRKALVIDLRGNPGGFVTAARAIASQFLAGGTIFWEQDAAGNLTQITAEQGGAATDPSIRVVVLVDGGSASASEIVAAALHDRGRAELVGTKTYGKGTVQQWTQFAGDNGGFRLTIFRWLTPDKTWVNGVGITPDVVVPTQAARPGDDPVLDAGLRALGFNPGG